MTTSSNNDNVKMYLISVSILPEKEGIDLPKMVVQLATVLADHSTPGEVVHKYKVIGEPRIVFCLHVSNPAVVERIVSSFLRVGACHVDCQPFVSYESFSRSIKVSRELAQASRSSLRQDGLYWLQFHVDYHGKSTEQLIKIWKKEAEAVFRAKRTGTLIELFKCVAQRKVHAFMNSSNPEDLDALSLQLPLMQENGANVQLTCKAIQFLDDYTRAVSSEFS